MKKIDPMSKIISSEDRYQERQEIEEHIEKNANLLIHHQKYSKIDSFTEYFVFLHNNFLTPVYFEGSLYPSVTHAYHAARSSDETTRKAILNADSFHTVANISSRIKDPEDWSTKRVDTMERLVRDKFRRSRELQEKIKATEKRDLIMTYEEDKIGNLFWGMVKQRGQNQLGRILMKIREDILSGKEILAWITTNFDLVTDTNYLPEISLTVKKNNNKIEHIVLKNKPFYKFGQLPDSDVVLLHPSISRLHAVIICDKNLGIVLVDLRSKSGTKLDDVLMQDHIPYRLKDGKKVHFAMSTRDYIIGIDLTKLKNVYEREKFKIKQEMNLLDKVEKSKNDLKFVSEVIKKTFKLDQEESDVIFVRGIPQTASEEELKSIFQEQFGDINGINWPNDRETGFKKNFCFIQFKTKESAKEAVEYGIIGLDIKQEEDENNYDIEERREKTAMLKIKYADTDRYRPNFSRANFERKREDKQKIKRSRSRSNNIKKPKRKVSSSSSDSDSSSSSSSSYFSNDSNSDSSSSSSSSSSSTIDKKNK